MGKFVKKQHAGGTAFHVSDCRVWAEIDYLDSPTDYREYLPGTQPRRNIGTYDPRKAPGDPRRPRQTSSYFLFFLACLFLLAIGLMLHLSGH